MIFFISYSLVANLCDFQSCFAAPLNLPFGVGDKFSHVIQKIPRYSDFKYGAWEGIILKNNATHFFRPFDVLRRFHAIVALPDNYEISKENNSNNDNNNDDDSNRGNDNNNSKANRKITLVNSNFEHNLITHENKQYVIVGQSLWKELVKNNESNNYCLSESDCKDPCISVHDWLFDLFSVLGIASK